MQKEDNDTSVTNEDTEILNLPLYTERKAAGIYRYRRRVPKPLVPRIGKGYLYRNLGKTKQEVVGKWQSAHAEIEEILISAIEGESKGQELIWRNILPDDCAIRGLGVKNSNASVASHSALTFFKGSVS